jgi:REP-associated tyrosine transposase
MVKEKHHRLPPSFYKGQIILSLTFCTDNRQIVFTNDIIFKDFENKLIFEMKKYESSAHIYLFMPDHLHMIISGNNYDSILINAVKSFKQKTGYYFSQQNSYFKWQKDYYDHIIRDEKDLGNQIMYILLNPVRKGFVSNWKDYPYKGSMIYDLNIIESF